MSLQPIVLDTDKTTPIYEVPLKIRQGDTGDELQVTLGKSFQKYTDLSTVDIELIAKTPDQRLIKRPVIDKSGNTFKVKFPDEMYTNVGVFRNMYFKVGDDSTSSVKLVVLQGIGSIKEAGSYIDDFETLIKEAESYVSALKDFADTGNAKIDSKVAELTGKMTDFVDKSKEDLDAAKAAWSTFKSNSQTAFTDAQDKRASDFNSQKAGFETDFNEQKTDFENRFKALLTTLQDDYDDFKALINKDVKDFNTSLDSLDSQATDVKNKYDALKAQLELATQNISGVRTNLYQDTRDFDNHDVWTNWSNWQKTGDKFNGLTVMAMNVDWGGLGQLIQVKKGETYTYSVYARYATGTGNSNVFTIPNGSTARVNPDNFQFSLDETWKRISATFTVLADGVVDTSLARTDNNTNTLLVAGIKLEKGSVATDYSVNPLDYLGSEGVHEVVSNAIKGITGIKPTDLSNYPTKSDVATEISSAVSGIKPTDLSNYPTKSDLSSFVTMEQVQNAVTKATEGLKPDLTNYLTKDEAVTQITSVVNSAIAKAGIDITKIGEANTDTSQISQSGTKPYPQDSDVQNAITNALKDYLTTDGVQAEIAKQIKANQPDLSNYPTRSEMATAIKELQDKISQADSGNIDQKFDTKKVGEIND